jgi:peptide/nickel transport system substrate-binding protein
VLSPGLPGYRPYCPYTRDPGPAGTWVGPDLARARLLVARSGTRGDRVVVWTDAEPFRRVVGSYLVSVLGRLGYRATLRVAPHYFVAIRQGEPQIGWYSWNLDYLSPLNVLAPNFECGAGLNPAGVCSRPLDARIEAAARDAASGSAAAPAEWSRIDRSLVDRAVMLPLVSLRSSVLVSRRVGNVVTNPQFGTLLDQLWVR